MLAGYMDSRVLLMCWFKLLVTLCAPAPFGCVVQLRMQPSGKTFKFIVIMNPSAVTMAWNHITSLPSLHKKSKQDFARNTCMAFPSVCQVFNRICNALQQLKLWGDTGKDGLRLLCNFKWVLKAKIQSFNTWPHWTLVSGVLRVLQTNVLGCIFFTKSVQGTEDKRAMKTKAGNILGACIYFLNEAHRTFHITSYLINVSSLTAIFVSSVILMLGHIWWLWLRVCECYLCFPIIYCEISECALICIISFLSFFPSQFSAPFCPEKLSNFLFWQTSDCLEGKKISFSVSSSYSIPQTRLPDRSPYDGTGACLRAVGALLLMAVPGRGHWGQQAPSAPLRQSKPCHTQSACVRRHKAASKEPTKQRSRLPLPNIMSLCSACLVGNPAAQAKQSACSLPCHISRRMLPGMAASHTTPGPNTQPQVRWGLTLLSCAALWPAVSYLDGHSWALCPSSMFWREVALLQEQYSWQSSQKGCSRQLGKANPSCGSLGGCVGNHKVSSHPCPDVTMLDKPPSPPGLCESSPTCVLAVMVHISL